MPTAASIVRFLALSNKRHIILTGNRGIGKSTLLRKILSLLSPITIHGIITSLIPRNCVLMKSSYSEKTSVIGSYNEDISRNSKKMSFVSDGFFQVGIPSVNEFLHSSEEWFFIDEVGYLESNCPEYCECISELLDKKRLAAVIRKMDSPLFDSVCARDDVCVIDLDAPFGNVGCVIMASGFSKRFGSNKLLVDIHGKPMINICLDLTEGIFSKRVIVTRYEEIAALCNNRRLIVQLHNMPYRSDTVRLGLDTLGNEMSGYIFIPADQPLLSRETIETIALCAKMYPNLILQLKYDGTHGAPILFPSWAYSELCSLPQGCGGNIVVKNHPDCIKYIDAKSEYELMDIDTPDDLAYIKSVLQ